MKGTGHVEWFTRFTHDPCPFISQCKTKKLYFNPYIYAKATNNPEKVKKNQCQFLCRMTSVFHWKIFATVFLCFIAGKCQGSVNIATWNDDVKFFISDQRLVKLSNLSGIQHHYWINKLEENVTYTVSVVGRTVVGPGPEIQKDVTTGPQRSKQSYLSHKILYILGIALYNCILYFIKLIHNNILWSTICVIICYYCVSVWLILNVRESSHTQQYFSCLVTGTYNMDLLQGSHAMSSKGSVILWAFQVKVDIQFISLYYMYVWNETTVKHVNNEYFGAMRIYSL